MKSLHRVQPRKRTPSSTTSSFSSTFTAVPSAAARSSAVSAGSAMAVVLMVPGDEEHGPAARQTAGEAHTGKAEAGVAGDDHGVGVGCRELEGAELDMEVADDV